MSDLIVSPGADPRYQLIGLELIQTSAQREKIVGIDTELSNVFNSSDCVIHHYIADFLESLLPEACERLRGDFGIDRQSISRFLLLRLIWIRNNAQNSVLFHSVSKQCQIWIPGDSMYVSPAFIWMRPSHLCDL